MHPTIRDVAKRLKLSITTVSRALDGYDDVAESTRELVVRVAREMGYVPNRAARQLRRRRSDTIGYILPASGPQFADPFYSEFIAGLGDEAATGNFDLLVSTAPPDSAQEQELYRRWVQGGKVDGLVINRTRLKDWRVRFLAAQKVPFTCLERSQDRARFVGVEVDSFTGFQELVAHLAAGGHRRIAYIGGPAEYKLEHDRSRGYQEGLRLCGLKADPALVTAGDLTPQSGFQAAARLLSLKRPPDAIVCVSDLTAIGAMHAAVERGLVVGRDLAIAGFDGIADSAHTQPPLTTLDQPVYTIARTLVSMLMDLIRGEEPDQPRIRLQPNLLKRASTGD